MASRPSGLRLFWEFVVRAALLLPQFGGGAGGLPCAVRGVLWGGGLAPISGASRRRLSDAQPPQRKTNKPRLAIVRGRRIFPAFLGLSGPPLLAGPDRPGTGQSRLL